MIAFDILIVLATLAPIAAGWSLFWFVTK